MLTLGVQDRGRAEEEPQAPGVGAVMTAEGEQSGGGAAAHSLAGIEGLIRGDEALVTRGGRQREQLRVLERKQLVETPRAVAGPLDVPAEGRDQPAAAQAGGAGRSPGGMLCTALLGIARAGMLCTALPGIAHGLAHRERSRPGSPVASVEQ